MKNECHPDRGGAAASPSGGIYLVKYSVAFAAVAFALVSIAGCTKPTATNQPAPVEPSPLVGQPAPTPEPTPTPTPQPAASTFTLAQVAQHSSRASCYSAIRGIVYDLTSWIDRHPGGPDKILSICGKDGSSAFVNQHEGEPRPEQMLASFKLGTLAQ
jgi:predicted heme/steroid binding protein